MNGLVCFGLLYLLGFLALVSMAFAFFYATRTLEESSIEMEAASCVDSQMLAFFVAYLFPLIGTTDIGFDIRMVLFLFFFLGAVLWSSHAFQFNPVLGLLGYHMYEVTDNSGLSHLLITKQTIKKGHKRLRVHKMLDHVYLECRPNR